MEIPECYRNREQTFVKHRLLRSYLERLFMIIGQSQRVIRYVDCFSGPWCDHDEKLEDTSIGISLEIMRRCHDVLQQKGKDVRFEALFIEKSKKAYEKLLTCLESNPSPAVSTNALNGDFFDLREDILKWCGRDDFTFFFIDPKGWKHVVEIETLEPLLRRPNSEFLINFMYDFLLRAHRQEAFQKEMHEIFGSVPKTSDMTTKQKETFLINLYRYQLKKIAHQKGGKPRTVYVRVLYPIRDRTFYHLVYLTRHAKGISVFMEASEKLELVQSMAREQAKQDHRVARTGQGEFDFEFRNGVKHIHNVELSEAKSYWVKKLSFDPHYFGLDQLADMIEETGWFERDLQAAFGELSRQGIVANIDDNSNRRRTKHVHFDARNNQGEALVRLK